MVGVGTLMGAPHLVEHLHEALDWALDHQGPHE